MTLKTTLSDALEPTQTHCDPSGNKENTGHDTKPNSLICICRHDHHQPFMLCRSQDAPTSARLSYVFINLGAPVTKRGSFKYPPVGCAFSRHVSHKAVVLHHSQNMILLRNQRSCLGQKWINIVHIRNPKTGHNSDKITSYMGNRRPTLSALKWQKQHERVYDPTSAPIRKSLSS